MAKVCLQPAICSHDVSIEQDKDGPCFVMFMLANSRVLVLSHVN